MEIRLRSNEADAGGIALKTAAARVTEAANGDYTLTVTLETGDARALLPQPGMILEARVPGKNLPLRHLEKTRGKVPRYRVEGPAVQVKRQVTEGEGDAAVTKEVTVTEHHAVTVWQDVTRTRQLGRLLHGSFVTGGYDADENGMRRVLIPAGETGWAECRYLIAAGETEADVYALCEEKAASMNSARFRIMKTEKDGDTVILTARHVYYDCDLTEIPPVTWQETPLSEALAQLSALNGRITLRTDRELRVSGSYQGKCSDIVRAICEEKDLQLVREGYTAYLPDAGNTERRFELWAEKGELRYRLTEDAGEMVTAFLPVVNGAAGAVIASPQHGGSPCGRTVLLTAGSVAEAEALAAARWNRGTDRHRVTAEVICQRNVLAGCALFDRVRLIDQRAGVDVEGAVSGMVYDPVNERICRVRLGYAGKTLKEDAFEESDGSWQRVSEA